MRVALSSNHRTSVYHSAMAMKHDRFAAWFQSQLARREWEQADFARYADTSTANVSRWVGGLVPSTKYIALIAQTFGVSVDEVYGVIKGEPNTTQPRSAEEFLAELEANQPVAVPIIQDLVAHMGSGGGFVADYWYLPPRYRKSKKKNILGVIAVGECMSPLIEPGDYVVFDTDAPWKRGDIVVAVVDGTMQVKRLIETEKRMVLRGDADGSTLTLGHDDQIFGRVIMFTRPLVPLET